MGGKQHEIKERRGSLRSDREYPTFEEKTTEPRNAVRSSKRLRERRDKLAFEATALGPKYLPSSPTVSRRKRKRPQAVDAHPEAEPGTEQRKKQRLSVDGSSSEHGSKRSITGAEENEDPIVYWSRYGHWPTGYFGKSDDMSQILTRKKSETSFARQINDDGSSSLGIATPSDEKPRELKSVPYRNPGYGRLLMTFGSFMRQSNQGISAQSEQDCHELLTGETDVPKDSLFRDNIFKRTCQNLTDRNEAKVIQDITRLIVPSAESLAPFGATKLECLIESVNEGWNSAIPLTRPRPQPDYAVGFNLMTFTEDQREKLEPFIGGVLDTSCFLATHTMFLPFLTCEVKCGAGGLNTADRQNAHSMTLAVRGVVELFRLAKRESELDRQVLAFSISHDDCMVKIYGHYAEIDGAKQRYYRHPINNIYLPGSNGKEKWTAYKFTKNVYEKWMPAHLQRLCSVIDELPSDVNFDVSQQSELRFTERSGLSEGVQASVSGASSRSSHKQAENHSSVKEAQNATPETSVNESGTFKKPSRKRGRKATRASSP